MYRTPGAGYTQIDSTPFCDVFRGSDGQIYIDWLATTAPDARSHWSSWSGIADLARQWDEDFRAMGFDPLRPNTQFNQLPPRWRDAIQYISEHYGPESSTVHHIGYSRGGAFAQMFGGRGYGSMTNPSMPVAPGAQDLPAEDWFHSIIHNWPHVPGGPFTPNPSQAGIPDQTPTTPVGPMTPPANVIEMFGHDDNGHSLLPAQVMGFRDSHAGGSLSGRSRFKSGYPANQTRRHTEQFGDLNAYSRVFQFYNYHGEKRQMLDEYCRALVVSLVRIQKGVVHDYDQPIAWPYPVHQPEATTTGGTPQKDDLDQYLNWIEFHFKDRRRDSGFYGKTLGSRAGTEGYTGEYVANQMNLNETVLAQQYQYDIQMNPIYSTCVPVWENVDGGRRMKSLAQLAKDIGDMFEKFAYIGADMTRAHMNADPTTAGPYIDSLDVQPCRIMLVKTLQFKVPGDHHRRTHDVIYDDEQFASSRVDVGSYTTVTIHNVSPASGDIAAVGDPMAADTITHVPLVGKMYTFSGSCPKVWDKHKADLHALFNPLFFRDGRYRLPASKLDDLKQFKTPPRGRAIWSNCIGESRIAIGPGQIKKLRMNFRIRDSLGEFWQKYRDHYLSDSRLGRTVCICLEPMIRREHIGEPRPVLLKKTYDAAEIDPTNYNPTTDASGAVQANTTSPFAGDVLAPLDAIVEYQPYELQTYEDSTTGLIRSRKVLRPMFNLKTLNGGTPGVLMYPLKNPAASQNGPTGDSQGIQYWWYDDGDANYLATGVKNLVGGRIVSPHQKATVPLDDPQYSSADPYYAICKPHGPPDAQNPMGAPTQAVGSWQLASWTDDPERCSKGDPMMFNIQINRMLCASTKLKKFIVLGADKTGIKRKWEDRLISNLGLGIFNDATDRPRDIDMFNQAGIKHVIPEGDAMNVSVAGGAAPQVTVQAGVTQNQVQAAMEAAIEAAHPLSAQAATGAVHTAGTHAGKLILDHHPLAGVTINQGKIAIDHSMHPLAGVVSNNKVQVEQTGVANINIASVNGTGLIHESVPVDIRREGQTLVRTDENTGTEQYRHGGYTWNDKPLQNNSSQRFGTVHHAAPHLNQWYVVVDGLDGAQLVNRLWDAGNVPCTAASEELYRGSRVVNTKNPAGHWEDWWQPIRSLTQDKPVDVNVQDIAGKTLEISANQNTGSKIYLGSKLDQANELKIPN